MKRFLSWVCAVSMLFSIASLGAHAETLEDAPEETGAAEGLMPDDVVAEEAVSAGEENAENGSSAADKNASFRVTVSISGGVEHALGDMIDYTLTVENDGDVTLHDIRVKDPISGDLIDLAAPGEAAALYMVTEDGESETAASVEALTPGEKAVLYASWLLEEPDAPVLDGVNFNGRDLNDTSGGTAKDPDGEDVEQESGNDEGDQLVIVGKDASFRVDVELLNIPEDEYAIGEDIEYKVTITNIGNVTLRQVTVNDPITGGTLRIDTADERNEVTELPVERLRRGDDNAVTFYCRYTVEKDDIVNKGEEPVIPAKSFPEGSAKDGDGSDARIVKGVMKPDKDGDGKIDISVFERLPGDVNADGAVTLSDSIIALRLSAKQSKESIEQEISTHTVSIENGVVWREGAWKDQNAQISLSDAVLILRFSAHQPVTLY